MRGKWCAQFHRGVVLAATPVVKERSAAVNGSGVADQATTDYLLTATPARLAADTLGVALTFAPTNFAGATIGRGVRTVAKDVADDPVAWLARQRALIREAPDAGEIAPGRFFGSAGGPGQWGRPRSRCRRGRRLTNTR